MNLIGKLLRTKPIRVKPFVIFVHVWLLSRKVMGPAQGTCSFVFLAADAH